MKRTVNFFAVLIAVIAVVLAYLDTTSTYNNLKKKKPLTSWLTQEVSLIRLSKCYCSCRFSLQLSIEWCFDGKYRLLDIIDNYGSTDAGNSAKYMAGIAYLRLNDYEKAIDALDDYSTDDEIYGSLAKGILVMLFRK
ncbi:MAG: hypothetical protein R2821_13650 [Flavobacteriaceae bacterium]